MIKKAFYRVFELFYNSVFNKVPSRRLRRLYLKCMGAKLGKGTVLFRRAEVLYPKGLVMGDFCSVGWFSSLDARGGLVV